MEGGSLEVKSDFDARIWAPIKFQRFGSSFLFAERLSARQNEVQVRWLTTDTLGELLRFVLFKVLYGSSFFSRLADKPKNMARQNFNGRGTARHTGE